MAPPEIEIVCFDLGGVLVRIARTWQDAMDAAGVSSRAGPQNKPLTDCTAFDAFQAARMDELTYLDELAAFLSISRAEAALAHTHILVEPYPGTEQLVADLRAAGYRTGCLSNTNAPHWETMLDGTSLPAIAALDVKLASHNLRLYKPDEAIFETFEKVSGHPPQAILFFDDATLNVEAARARGWRAHLIDPDGDPVEQMRAAMRLEGMRL